MSFGVSFSFLLLLDQTAFASVFVCDEPRFGVRKCPSPLTPNKSFGEDNRICTDPAIVSITGVGYVVVAVVVTA